MKCIVIGSGIAGLASAVRLSKKGYAVTVLEANSYPGGKLSETVNGNYRFDAGPSLLTMPHLIDELFEISGEDPRRYFNYIKCGEACHYFYPDGIRFTCPADEEGLVQTLHDVFNEDKIKLKAFVSKSKKLYNITAPVFLENSLKLLSTYIKPTGIKGILNLRRLNMFSTMNEINSKYFRHPATAQFFNRYATYNGSDPYRAPATLNVIPHLEYAYGTFFPQEGMISITNSLYELARRNGVVFKFNERAEEILIDKGKVRGVRTSDTILESDIVLSNMDVNPLYDKLLKGFKKPVSLRKSEPSSSALIFYWGIKREFPELGLHNIFFSRDYKNEFETIFKSAGICDDPTVYINISSKLRKEDAPQGSENWFVMVNVPSNSGQDWDELIIRTRKNIIEKLSAELKTDITKWIECESILDPRSIEIKTSSMGGALYGSSSNHILSAFFRHANFKSDIKGLFFCGGSVHPGGGIPLCLMGAKIVSGLIKSVKPE